MTTRPFYYQRVKDPDELQRYRLNYLRLSGNELPESYLRNALVYQFYCGPQAVAGFILNTSRMNPLRYLSYLDSSIRNQMLTDENLKEGIFLEITANYKLPELRHRESRIYYTVMLTEAYRHAKRLRKTYLMGGSVIKAVKLIQQELMERVIYHGPVSHQGQETVKEKAALLKIYVIELSQLPLRATIVLVNRYVVRSIKNRIKRSVQKWFKKRRPSGLSQKQEVSGLSD